MRVLTVKEALKLREERQEKEDTELAAKARRATLFGKGKFVKMVWKEMPIAYDYFV